MTISRTYIISLPERLTDRLIPLIDFLKSIEVDYFVVPAIKNEKDPKHGLVLTVEKLLTECMYAEYESVLVIEDDMVVIVDDFLLRLNLYISQLPKKWDCLYLGVNLFQDNVELVSENLIRLESGYATHAILYSKSGIRKVLEAIRIKKHNHLPLDAIIVKQVQKDGNCYCTFPLLCSQKSGFSDIEGRVVDYKDFLEDRFNKKTSHLKNNLVE